jgi:Tol biopolymer transport system component
VESSTKVGAIGFDPAADCPADDLPGQRESSLGDFFPTISQDWKELAFTRRAAMGFGAVYLVRIDDAAKPIGQPQKIQSGTAEFAASRWAEGKEWLAYSPLGWSRLPAEGSDHPQLLPGFGSNVNWLDVSRRGNRLAYSTTRGDANVWRLELGADRLAAKGSRPQRLIASTFRDVYPEYSPDGKKLAFYSNRGGSAQLWMENADGALARQLTFLKKGTTGTPSWSPDGKMLAFDSNATGFYQVYTMSAEGGKRRSSPRQRRPISPRRGRGTGNGFISARTERGAMRSGRCPHRAACRRR